MKHFMPICENNLYRRMYARGKSIVTPSVVIYYSKNRTGDLRLGITTSKKIGNAVKRNRARRIIREAFRNVSPWLRRGYDYILVARGRTPFLKSTDIERLLIATLKERNLYLKED